jgi:hypothetical protein
MAAGMLQGLTPLLEQFFLNPLGILALAGLIPLLIFYLVRPEPEEKVMPSMMFFRSQEADSKLRNAMRTLLRNLILLLHILLVIGFALAIANPYIQTMEKTDSSVVVVDRSASMEGKTAEILDFLDGKLAKDNTVILVDDEVSVEAQEATPERVKSIVSNMEYEDTETDIATGIQTGLNYPGNMLLASDLHQTVDSRNIKQKLDSTSKPVEAMDVETQNRLGVTELNIQDNTTEVGVTSFYSNNRTLNIDINDETREFTLRPGYNTLEVEHSTGRNTVELPEDQVPADNSAYFYVPERGRIGVELLGAENRYFEKAVELIRQTEEHVSTPESPADVYALRESPTSLDAEQIREDVEGGGAAIVFPGSDAMSEVFDFEASDQTKEGEVTLNFLSEIEIGETTYIDRSIEGGESLSDPAEAVKIHEYGEGRVLAFNVDSQRFRENLMYPVFWKETILRISDRPTVDELNLQTGTTVSYDSLTTPEGEQVQGQVELEKTGFYTTDSETFSVNLLSQEESSVQPLDYESSGNPERVMAARSLQNLSIVVILFLILLELSYLRYRGDI